MLASLVIKSLFALGMLAGGCYVVVQMVDETRDKMAALVLKPVPALCCSIACFLSMTAVTSIASQSAGSGIVHRRRCRVDTWCFFFGIGFALFAIGDALLSVHVAPSSFDSEGIATNSSVASESSSAASSDDDGLATQTKLDLSGVLMFMAGQLMLLIGMYTRRIDDVLPSMFDGRIAAIYATAAGVLWIAFVAGSAASPACDADLAAAILLATYFVIVVAVAWRACDVFASRYSPTGALCVAFGAHLFLVSDVFVGSNSMCALMENNPAAYYFWAMTTYYAAIVMEGWGVAAFAIETRVMSNARRDFAA